ncbi:hypothetical protein HGQ98_20695, partial [Achromobacter ruhlandii]|nr:hypothetical protein [Achromobacter ruhlandii]
RGGRGGGGGVGRRERGGGGWEEGRRCRETWVGGAAGRGMSYGGGLAVRGTPVIV